MGRFIEKSFPQGHQQDSQVKTHRPVLNVVEVMFNSLLKRGISPPPVDLGPPRHPCFNFVSKYIRRDLISEFFHKIWSFWSGTHHAHLSPEHVEQLRKLIQTGFS